MSIFIVFGLTFMLYAFLVTLTIENTLLNLGFYFILDSFTFFIMSLVIIVEMIRVSFGRF